MDLQGILSISGYSGLFKMIKQTKTGFIVESLVDKKRIQAFASSKISTLEDIAIYTETSELHLKELLQKIFQQENEKKLELTSKSSNEESKAFFAKVLSDYDKESVYVSDMKKVVVWYNLLVDSNLIDLKEDEPEEKEEEIKETTEPEKKKPEKKAEKKEVKKLETKEIEKKEVAKTKKQEPKNVKKKEDTKKEE